MNKIIISLKKEQCPVYVDYPLSMLGYLLKKHPCGEKVIVITDENAGRLFSEDVVNSLKGAAKKIKVSTIKPGESSKTINVAYNLLKECSLFNMERSDVIVGLGGGVICDLAGFVSSIYLRGIRFISIPTTLLAQVDASIGGKTAINLPWGKNLVGAFHQPFFVLMDFSTLKTLPDREVSQGMAEIIKSAVIRSSKLFNYLKKIDASKVRNYLRYLVPECVMIKKRVVERDEKEEKGIREILNFGHTLGHAIEINSKRLNHGESVSVGMVGETFFAFKKGICSYSTYENVRFLVKKYRLPTRSDVSAEMAAKSILFDKKTKCGKCRFVLPVRIGAVKTGVEITPNEIISNWEKWNE
ncbi:MAG: 3-dehydroquinate synthase [Candidatus Omnitrophica bacterium]|nr:3-dehydroquinate synthase [Candidatus Omnitrophota bacterium]MCM8824706.1 3-dehydroquinate synthase [Candidatus Omnitrophota bacterium]